MIKCTIKCFTKKLESVQYNAVSSNTNDTNKNQY